MNKEQFLEIFNDIDEEIIQQANEDVNSWLKDRSGIIVRADEKRVFPWKTVIATAACTAAVLSGVFFLNKSISVSPAESSGDSFYAADSFYHLAEADGWEIRRVQEDYTTYRSAEELVSAADVVFVGKVRAFGSAAVDYKNGLPWGQHDITDTVDIIELCPYGDIEVITPYKGLDAETDMIPFVFTMKDLYLGGQSQIISATDSDKIMVVYDMPEITIGETYLFSLRSDGTFSERKYGDTYTCLLNPYQSVINISEPSAKDKYGYLSAKDIISYFGNDAINTGTVYYVVDPVDDIMRRELDFSDTKITIHNLDENYEYDPTIDGSVVSLGYLKEFFGNDGLPFDGKYKDNLERAAFNATYRCKVLEGAKAYTPVDGRVVAINDHGYNGGLGRAVAIEFEDKVFILAHLAEVNVKVGDNVTAGQAVGICGTSGAVDDTVLSIITMIKLSPELRSN